MKKILFPTDYSPASAAALRYAISLARQAQAKLLVVHVEPPSIPPLGTAPVTASHDLAEQDSLAAQLTAAADHADSPLTYQTRHFSGDPVRDLVRLAEREGVDLIVMATSGRSGLRRMLLGSVAEAVVRSAPCPVLTLKEPASESDTVGSLPDRDETTADDETIDFRDPGQVIAAAGKASAQVLLEQAAGQRATDIHLHPTENGQMEVRLRVDGRLEHLCRLDERTGDHLLQQLKVLAELDISDPFHPQEGRLHTEGGPAGYEIRITTVPVVGGESAALRLLKRERLLRPLETLGLADQSLAAIQHMLHQGRGEGVVLVTGPANAGKTTTAYSMVNVLDDGHRNILTIEDPPEFRIPSFRQLAASPRHHISMTSGLRTLLRMDPDIVLVGEIRDVETAEIAMRAASSGKFIFTTLHTRDVASTVTALRDLKIDNRSLGGNLTGIISQRLVRRLCEHCRKETPVDDEAAAAFAAEGLSPPERVYSASGCDRCQQTGYFERIGIYEVVSPDRELCEAIEAGLSENELRAMIRDQGIPALANDALAKVSQGITSLSETREMTWASRHL